MILFQEKFINDKEIESLLNLWDEDIVHDNSSSGEYRALAMKWVDIKKHNLDISFLHNGGFCDKDFTKIRIQQYHEDFGWVEAYHGHNNIHNYIIFLNDDFEGGELEFKNGLTIKPSKGGLVYFNNNEVHRVMPHKGFRYVFIALGNNEADIQFQYKNRKSII